jgi:hypothetical protein
MYLKYTLEGSRRRCGGGRRGLRGSFVVVRPVQPAKIMRPATRMLRRICRWVSTDSKAEVRNSVLTATSLLLGRCCLAVTNRYTRGHRKPGLVMIDWFPRSLLAGRFGIGGCTGVVRQCLNDEETVFRVEAINYGSACYSLCI